MSRLRVFVVLIFTLPLVAPQSANAIFGLSQCEKATNSIKAEQAIGLENFKTYDQARDALLAGGTINFQQAWDTFVSSKL